MGLVVLYQVYLLLKQGSKSMSAVMSRAPGLPGFCRRRPPAFVALGWSYFLHRSGLDACILAFVEGPSSMIVRHFSFVTVCAVPVRVQSCIPKEDLAVEAKP